MHPNLITKLAETVVADRLAEAERLRRAPSDDNPRHERSPEGGDGRNVLAADGVQVKSCQQARMPAAKPC